jgi:ribosomal RNA-processing protein 1
VRDAAVDSLRTYLSARPSLSSAESLKLWKGLFYCMWMSDKPRNQQQLARDLAALVDVLRAGVVVPFLEGFWITMGREWSGIDVLR